MKIEIISSIVGLLVVGAAILTHSINIDNKLNAVSEKHQSSNQAIKDIEGKVSILKSDYNKIKVELESKNNDFEFLRIEVAKTNDMIIESSEKTRDMLINILSGKK